MKELDHLLKKIKQYNPQTDEILIQLAFDFAQNIHKGQKRLTGEDYIMHSLGTAHYLADMKLSDTMIIGALLHDVLKDKPNAIDEIHNNFGQDISDLVLRVSSLGKLKYRGVTKYRENLRKMFITIAHDIRAVLIKFADRIHNLETLYTLPPYKQKRIACETLEIYAPIAHRLGIVHMQNILEHKAFPYAFPEEHKWVNSLIPDDYIKNKSKQLDQCISVINSLIKNHTVDSLYVYGRTKQLYSLYQKLLRKNKEFDKVYDFVALRILVRSVEDCYKLLGLLHQRWKPISGRIKDYISQPKENGYQSLHTTIFDDDGHIIEIQIRTDEMHEEAEYGVAAHWIYKENAFQQDSKTQDWLKDLSQWQKELEESQQFIESLKLDVFDKKIFLDFLCLAPQ